MMMMMATMYTNAFLLALCLSSPFLTTQVEANHNHWGLDARGGASKPPELPSPTTTKVQSAAGILVLGEDHHQSDLPWLPKTLGNSCVLFGVEDDSNLSPLMRMSNLPQDDTMVESLGLVCNVLVVVLPAHENGELETLIPALLKMAYRRLTLGMEKGKLVIVSPNASDSWWVDDIVTRRLPQVTTVFWQIFDIMTPESLSKDHWNDVLSESRSVADLLPYEDNSQAFAKLLQQMYQSGGSPAPTEDFALQPIPSEQPKPPVKKPEQPSHSQSPSISVATSADDDGDDDDIIEEVLGLAQTQPIPSEQLKPLVGKPEQPSRPQSPSISVVTSADDDDDVIQEVLRLAQTQLEAFESKMEEIMLEQQMPLLDFGRSANEILEGAYKGLEHFPPGFRLGLLKRIVVELQRLYKDQLQSLRDYYGRRYETTLETREDEGEWATAAEHMTQGFQAAVQHAVPSLCQKGGALANVAGDFDGSVDALQGLIKDMMEATQLRKDEQSLAFEDYDDDDDAFELSGKRRVPKWLKKLAARGFALGVNYIQGWLAWQGIKRAALERDKNMPKFPLF
jgi:hypothetical protein